MIMPAKHINFSESLLGFGSYILQRENQEKLFLNAYRVRRLIVDKMNELFKKYDGLIMPVGSGICPAIVNIWSSSKV